MPWKDVKVSEQRIRFVLRASSGSEEMAGLCREFGISRPTGYRWLKRFGAVERIEDLREVSRRPNRSPRQTEAELEARVVEERTRRPDWGAAKLRVVLERQGVSLNERTIHRILARRGLIQPQRQHPPALRRFERELPNQLWQMDFKGLPDKLARGWAPLSVLDDCSRFALALRALETSAGRTVREALTGVFEDHGLPEAMVMDHGKPWWNAQHPNGWTQLSIWLMNLGIRLHFAAVRHPQTQGKVERFHRSLQDAMDARGFPTDRTQWPGWLEEFRQEYNDVRPHESLAMETPASRWKTSSRPFPATPTAWEYDAGGELKRVRHSGRISLGDSQEFFISAALAGQWVQLQPLTSDRFLVFYRRTCVRELNVQKHQSWPVYFSREQQVFDNE